MMRVIKTLHGWLGIFVMPWIIIIGLTGLYLNHSKLVLSFLPISSYDEAEFDNWPNPVAVDETAAHAVAVAVFPGDNFKKRSQKKYHDRDVFMFDGASGRVIVAKDTGHYWVKTRVTRTTYDPDGRKLDGKVYWGSLFKNLHTKGWANSGFGTWFADITAGAMVLFGLSGIYMFFAPRLRRRSNKQGRENVEVARKNVPRPKRIQLKN